MRSGFALLSVILGFIAQCHCAIFTFDFSRFSAVQDTHKSADASCLTFRKSCGHSEEFTSFDGTCNNKENPTWGAGKAVLRRLVPPEYDDSKSVPRFNGKYGGLASTRKISNAMKDSNDGVSSSVSHMHVLWGQVLAHDIVHTPVFRTPSGGKLDCNCDFPDHKCINIELPPDDTQRIRTGKKCFGLARSAAAKGANGCQFPHREQTTTMSSFIDGTFIYGKTTDESNDLRDFSSQAGELKLVHNPAHATHKNLPNQNELGHKEISKTMDCDPKVHKPIHILCFVAGDVRANENPGLQSIQTIWARYHNIVARGLKGVNRYWTSDRVYKMARKIVSALIQSITYREYLPYLLGHTWMERFDLKLTENGYWNGYDSRYNPSIANSFTTAAFRYGHSQVAESMSRPSAFFTNGDRPSVASKSTFFSTEALLETMGGGSGSLLRGFMVDNALKTDNNFAEALRNHLFVQHGKIYGGDLFAINTQRGRDHGLPGYNKFRELCGLQKASTFSDLAGEMSGSDIHKLQSVYGHVDDIDLYVGGVSETHVAGGEVGPTFACILGDGFRAIRRGDRYWHELENSPSPFTHSQLQSIKKTTFASVLCLTGEDMKYVMKLPMTMKNGQHGLIVNCGNVDNLDFSLWRDAPHSSGTSSPKWEEEWTAWFVTSETQKWRLNPANAYHKLKQSRSEEICDDYTGSETRKVPGDANLQIRFSCRVGTIASTDFPFQVSQNTRWSEWIIRQQVDGNEFGCDHVIAIQAMTTEGMKYASETGDVFERFGPDGFSCQHRHQQTGFCHPYKVRALCERNKDDNQVYPAPPPSDSPVITTTMIPYDIKDITKSYCQQYDLCCDDSQGYYLIFIPSHVTTHARSLCKKHKVCCDA